MSIAEQIKRIQCNIKNAYTSLEEKGAELPTERNSNNLATTIASISGGGSDEYADAIFSTGLPAKIEIPKHITKVRDYACYNYQSYPVWEETLEEISGENVEELGNYAFGSQANLKKIDFPKVTRVGKNCFNLGSSPVVEYLRLGELEYIGSQAFQYLNIDYSFKLAQGCTIESNAFYGTSLTSFDFTGVKSIGAGCFKANKVAMKIWLPSTVEKVSMSAASDSFFYNGKKGTIYTDVADADSVPSGWGSNWKYNVTVVYGTTYQDFLNA